jgi:hypothetical protein
VMPRSVQSLERVRSIDDSSLFRGAGEGWGEGGCDGSISS